MKQILLVDGYNILHAWPDLHLYMKEAGLAAARDHLINRVHDYSASAGFWAVVVFDAHHGHRHNATVEHHRGMDVIYTGAGETADHHIERIAQEMSGKNCELYVVTGDHLEQTIILGKGAVRVSPREFLEDIRMDKETRRKPQTLRGSRLEDRISPKARQVLEDIRRESEK